MTLIDLESAQIQTLKSDPDYAGLTKGTFSGRRPKEPKDTQIPDSSFPYVVFGTSSSGASDFASHNDEGEDTITTVHIWSRYQGKKEVYEIYQIIRRILHRTRLNLPTSRQVRQDVRLVSVIVDPDGKTYHGVVRIKSSTQ